jgi:hypothetical protein
MTGCTCLLRRCLIHTTYSAVQLPLMRDPATMLGHCVGCRKMYTAEGEVVEVQLLAIMLHYLLH